MRIGTYNVQGFRGYPPETAARALGHPDDEGAGAYFARILDGLGCDILAVQEGPSARQMHRVAGRLGCRMAGFSSPLHLTGYLLSRFPILEARTFSRWRPLADRWPFSRMGGEAVLRLADGSRLLVIALQLNPRHERVRRAEATQVRERLIELAPAADHAAVLGEFNAAPAEPIHAWLRDLGFTDAVRAARDGIQPPHEGIGAEPPAAGHIYLSRSLAPALVRAEVVRQPEFWHDGAAPPGAWLPSALLPAVAEVGPFRVAAESTGS
jgi:endonuclease/exonuclease/phosphatase family metal-dependent hydrolase